MVSNNKTFYPTPRPLILKMINKIDGIPKTILEPSAGKGDIVDALIDHYRHRRHCISVIEKDPVLQATLKGKDLSLIDDNFLTFAGPDKFDLIIGNPPFDEGDKHLLKAIDIMYSGQIVFLLNAETIRNANTNTRNLLKSKLEELEAEVEFIPNAFLNAERKTGVEVALVNINIKRDVESDLFSNMDKAENPEVEDLKGNHELATKNKIRDLVAEYNRVVETGIETYVGFFKNYKIIGKYITIGGDGTTSYDENLTGKMKVCVNSFVQKVREDFWKKALNLDEVYRRLTQKQSEVFHQNINQQAKMDFTEKNIRQFVLNVIGGYDRHLYDAVVKLFDDVTYRYAWDEDLKNGNVHYFTGWKTNKAFRVNKRIIFPLGYGDGTFSGFNQRWTLNYQHKEKLRDFDIVMNYFDGMRPGYYGIIEAIEKAFGKGQNTKIESSYFVANLYRKGTIHLTWKDENILRRFNICACKEKSWLPFDYGKKPYQNMTGEEKNLVNEFEEKLEDYHNNLGLPDFDYKNNLNLICDQQIDRQTELFN